MKIQIYRGNNYISISFFKIDFIKVKQLLEYISIDYVSILRDESNKYIFDNHIFIDDFMDYISNINTSIIIFDGKVESCLMDNELDILIKRKMLVDINLGENQTSILINTRYKDEFEKILKDNEIEQIIK